MVAANSVPKNNCLVCGKLGALDVSREDAKAQRFGVKTKPLRAFASSRDKFLLIARWRGNEYQL